MADPGARQPEAPVHVMQPQFLRKGPFSADVPNTTALPGETRPRRNAKNIDALVSTPPQAPDVRTAYDIVRYSARTHGDAKCVGSRELLNTHKEPRVVHGKQVEWQTFELGPYSYLSYTEFQQHVDVLGSGLHSLGLSVGDKLHLYGATSLPWMSLAHAAFTQSLTVVTAYDSLGLQGLRASLQQTASRAIFVDSALLPVLEQALPDTPALRYIILRDADEEQTTSLRDRFPQLHVSTYDKLQELGRANPAEHVPPQPVDLACVMYTSGTSGTPKGVTITHEALIAAVVGASSVVQEHFTPGDSFLAYLPSAHIIEFVLENGAIFWGATLGYGSPKTLTDTSVRNCKGDLAEFRPTALVGVPAVWELIKKGITAKVAASGRLRSSLFWTAVNLKQKILAAGLPGAALIDSLIFAQVRAAVGGRLRVAFSGGGPLSRETQVFMSTVLAPIINGYGLTETTGMGALMDPLAWTPDAQGEIPCCLEAKLVDFTDAGYLVTNSPPQGELWVRGPSVTKGYYENEEETRAAFGPDGWFMTGDIAEFDSYGLIKIIDRKKNLVKTLKGEYIALEKLESVYRSSPLVANICVYASPTQEKPIAIMVPAEAALKDLARNAGIEAESAEALADNAKLRELVLKDLNAIGRRAQLSGIELLAGVVIETMEWTSVNGFLTASQKIQRRAIGERNKDGIERAYNKI